MAASTIDAPRQLNAVELCGSASLDEFAAAGPPAPGRSSTPPVQLSTFGDTSALSLANMTDVSVMSDDVVTSPGDLSTTKTPETLRLMNNPFPQQPRTATATRSAAMVTIPPQAGRSPGKQMYLPCGTLADHLGHARDPISLEPPSVTSASGTPGSILTYPGRYPSGTPERSPVVSKRTPSASTPPAEVSGATSPQPDCAFSIGQTALSPNTPDDRDTKAFPAVGHVVLPPAMSADGTTAAKPAKFGARATFSPDPPVIGPRGATISPDQAEVIRENSSSNGSASFGATQSSRFSSQEPMTSLSPTPMLPMHRPPSRAELSQLPREQPLLASRPIGQFLMNHSSEDLEVMNTPTQGLRSASAGVVHLLPVDNVQRSPQRPFTPMMHRSYAQAPVGTQRFADNSVSNDRGTPVPKRMARKTSFSMDESMIAAVGRASANQLDAWASTSGTELPTEALARPTATEPSSTTKLNRSRPPPLQDSLSRAELLSSAVDPSSSFCGGSYTPVPAEQRSSSFPNGQVHVMTPLTDQHRKSPVSQTCGGTSQRQADSPISVSSTPVPGSKPQRSPSFHQAHNRQNPFVHAGLRGSFDASGSFNRPPSSTRSYDLDATQRQERQLRIEMQRMAREVMMEVAASPSGPYSRHRRVSPHDLDEDIYTFRFNLRPLRRLWKSIGETLTPTKKKSPEEEPLSRPDASVTKTYSPPTSTSSGERRTVDLLGVNEVVSEFELTPERAMRVSPPPRPPTTALQDSDDVCRKLITSQEVAVPAVALTTDGDSSPLNSSTNGVQLSSSMRGRIASYLRGASTYFSPIKGGSEIGELHPGLVPPMSPTTVSQTHVHHSRALLRTLTLSVVAAIALIIKVILGSRGSASTPPSRAAVALLSVLSVLLGMLLSRR